MFAPHLCIVGKHEKNYFVRVGSNFERASHGLLAGMFGKQPTPQIFAMFSVAGHITPDSYAPLITTWPTSTTVVSMTLVIRNSGVSIAKDLFVNIELRSPGPECEPKTEPNEPIWTSHKSVGGFHMVSAPHFRLGPGAMLHCVKAELFMLPPFDNPLSYEITFGCAGSQVHRLSAEVQPETISAAVTSFLGSNKDSAAGSALASIVFGTERAGADYRAAIDS